MEFFAEPMETPGLLEKLSELAPQNPFCSPGYLRAMQLSGAETWIAGLRDGEQLMSASGVFIRRGRLNSTLGIDSLPAAAGAEEYWSGLLHFCSDHGVSQIEANSYSSPTILVPRLTQECERHDRCEYFINLLDFSFERVSSNHRRNIRKAKGLTITRSIDQEACRDHIRLMDQSQERRRKRGEAIAGGASMAYHLALLECGSGELFQARLEQTVVSSILILRSLYGAYYQSAGTSPEGMALGASHFLVNGTACLLREEGLKTFNLGGAPPDSTLARFKTGFGAKATLSTAVSLYVGSIWRRKLTTLLRLARKNRKSLFSALVGNLSINKVYVGETSAVMPQVSVSTAKFVPLGDDDLRTLDVGDSGFRQRQLERLARFGRSYAFGVIVEGKLAHISWLLPAAAIRTDSPVVLRPREDQAEITACETLPEFRGMCIYGFAIQNLFAVAHRQGIAQVYMKTAWGNKASQRGIRKAGLVIAGFALLLAPPLLPGRTWVFRLFR